MSAIAPILLSMLTASLAGFDGADAASSASSDTEGVQVEGAPKPEPEPEPEPASAEAKGSASLSLGGGAKADGDAKAKKKDKAKKKSKAKEKDEGEAKGKKSKAGADGDETPWIRRWPPERTMYELGIFGGVYLPGKNHELFQADLALPDQGFRRFATLAPEIGLRVSFMPLKFFGAELEGAVMPTSTDNDVSATLWTVRGGLIGQLPRWSITPFLVVGTGLLAVSSDRDGVGNDIDPMMYFGGGAKFYLSRLTMLRLDLRDVVSHKREVSETFQNHNFEALLSFAITLGRDKPQPPPRKDTDGDGFYDDEDQCVDEPGVAPDGCPIRDSDGDGFLDPEDRCVDEPGVAPDGCPIHDKDGDGFLDEDDACPEEAGVDPDGCPIRDTDGDGIFDDVDQCIPEPETKNGYEDDDGCPDEVPEEVKRFTGAIEGIYFDVDKATIRKKSTPVLESAYDVLAKFPSVSVEISGHTDDSGNREHNLELSKNRADAVKKYLVDKGIDAGRITTRGAGPDEPIDTNRTKSGRAKNRRIEFKILNQ